MNFLRATVIFALASFFQASRHYLQLVDSQIRLSHFPSGAADARWFLASSGRKVALIAHAHVFSSLRGFSHSLPEVVHHRKELAMSTQVRHGYRTFSFDHSDDKLNKSVLFRMILLTNPLHAPRFSDPKFVSSESISGNVLRPITSLHRATFIEREELGHMCFKTILDSTENTVNLEGHSTNSGQLSIQPPGTHRKAKHAKTRKKEPSSQPPRSELAQLQNASQSTSNRHRRANSPSRVVPTS